MIFVNNDIMKTYNLVAQDYSDLTIFNEIVVLCRYWYPKAYHRVPNKSQTHRYFVFIQYDIVKWMFILFSKYNPRALQDIKESLQELKFYKSTIFK